MKVVIFTANSSILLLSRVRKSPATFPSWERRSMITMTIMISTSVNPRGCFENPWIGGNFGVVFGYIIKSMNRVLIPLLLAIVSFAFALDSSASILQAKNITDTMLSVSWTPIQDAVKYRIYYDESVLLDPLSPNPLLDTEYIEWLMGSITQLTPSTDYTIVVQWFTADGMELAKTIPLHARTYAPKPLMNISGNPEAINEKTIEIAFTRGINLIDTQLTLKNTVTGKMVWIWALQPSPEDLRVVLVPLTTAMEEWVTYELSFKNVIALDGSILSAENKVPLKVIWSTQFSNLNPNIDIVSADVDIPSSDVSSEAPLLTEPVPIDRLPQTGPNSSLIFLALLISGLVFFVQKKLSKRA